MCVCAYDDTRMTHLSGTNQLSSVLDTKAGESQLDEVSSRLHDLREAHEESRSQNHAVVETLEASLTASRNALAQVGGWVRVCVRVGKCMRVRVYV